MRLNNVLKSPVRSFVRAVHKVLSQRSMQEHKRKQRVMEDSYSLFCELSRKEGISRLTFDNGKAIITLSDGRYYWFDATDSVTRMYTVPYTGTFEAKETEFVRSLIKPRFTCFDIGANFGWYTILLSQAVGKEGRVHAFEPLPQTVNVLETNVRLNHCENITVNRMALDESSGEKELYLPDIGVSGSFRLHEYSKTYQVIKCTSQRLDDYCFEKGIERVDFIKADIEGAEWSMLKGATKTLLKNRPVLFLEIQEKSTKLFGYQPAELFDWLIDLEYSAYYIGNSCELVRVNNHRESLPDYNFFFLP